MISSINESEKSLDIIQQASDEMIFRLKDMVWTIQPGYDTLEQLLGKIKEYAIFITGAKNIKLHTHFSNNGQSLKLSTEARHHIYTIIKEILNNAVKYSESSDIFLTAVINKDNLIFKVKDNGKGFDTIQPTDGNGLTNIRTKAAELAGILEINSLPGKGTAIALKLKFTQQGIV